jgi:RHS repeat-associated protein
MVTANATQTITTPSGYTLVQSATATGNTGQTAVFRKTATGTEASATVTFGTGLTPKAALAVVYRGVDPTNPVDVKTSSNAQLSSTLTTGSITTSATDERLVLLAGAVGNTAVAPWTAPTGMTDRVHLAGQALVSTLIADQTLTTSGPTGSRTATLSGSGDLTGVLLALRVAPAATYYYQGDQLGSTRVVTDQYGSIAATYSYDPYGNTTSHTGYLDTPLQYNGQYQDSETKLLFLRARYYDPVSGQFLTRDPLEAATRSPYAYAASDPLDASDPSGLCIFGHNAQGGCRGGNAYNWAVRNLDPAYLAIQGYASEWDAYENHCSAWTIFKFGAQGVIGLVSTVGTAVGVGAAARGLGAAESLGDDVVLVRGGTNTAEQIPKGTGVQTDAAGNVHGVSVNSGPTIEDAAQGIPHKQIGTTTVGDVRQAGGTVVRDPVPGNPGHCLVGGMTAEALSGLLTPTIKNPCL